MLKSERKIRMFLLSGGYYKNNHSCFLFSVLVKKYRYPCSTDVVKDALLQYTRSYFEQCDCIIQEVNTDKDHVHILFDALPHIHLVKFINSFKSGNSRKIRSTHGSFLRQYYWKPYFWSNSYFIVTVSGRSAEVVQKYIQNQGG